MDNRAGADAVAVVLVGGHCNCVGLQALLFPKTEAVGAVEDVEIGGDEGDERGENEGGEGEELHGELVCSANFLGEVFVAL